ncbi:MAG: hypothetical protein ACTSYD_08730 [Candidatus Heimdallarchaeaceae archaeon]
MVGLLKLSLPPILNRLPSTILNQYSLQPSNLLQLSIAPTYNAPKKRKKILDMLILDM